MAYPTVDAPYGFKPINLIGGQVYAGSTRMIPIAYGYNTSIYNGDVVSVLRGQVNRQAVTTAGSLFWNATITAAAGGALTVASGALGVCGVFVGCSYTNPATNQKLFSQYWPAGTLAGDAVAYVVDDPDALFRAAVVTTQGGTTIGSVAPAMVGQNITASDLAGVTGVVTNGNSRNALFNTAVASQAASSAWPFRIVEIVRDTAITLGTAVYSSGTSTITTAANVTFAVPIGAQLAWVTSAGVVVDTGSYVTTAIAANNTTSVVLSAAPLTTPSASATLVFIQYPEAIVKFNFGAHEYYNSLAV